MKEIPNDYRKRCGSAVASITKLVTEEQNYKISEQYCCGRSCLECKLFANGGWKSKEKLKKVINEIQLEMFLDK